MDTSRARTGRIVGSLFLLSNATFLVGAMALVEPALGTPDFLNLASTSGSQVMLGALLEIINGIAYLGIAFLMFPIFRRNFKSLALGYVGFRLLEFVMQILSDIAPLMLVSLSRGSAASGVPDAASLQVLGTLLVAQRFWAFQMISITFGLGALMFYSMLYQMRLIPRLVSVWGLAGAGLVLANLLLDMFGAHLGIVENLGVLMLLNELFLGVWLIIKGFNPSESAHAPVAAGAVP